VQVPGARGIEVDGVYRHPLRERLSDDLGTLDDEALLLPPFAPVLRELP
jgi:hypothetical protein